MLKRFTHSPVFWTLQVLVLLICTGLCLHFYSKTFPIVDLQIKMDRGAALKQAAELAKTHEWGPSHFRQSASFESDGMTQTFVELAAGGKEVFSKIIQEGLYSPFTWSVRHFAEKKANETQIRFTPQGTFYGFTQKIPEDAPGKALDVSSALKLAENSAVLNWKIPLNQYVLIEKSQEATIKNRIDHSFVYERPNFVLGEGRYRLRLVVSGDQLTEIRYFIKIPDSFSREYGERRSFNNTIAEVASVFMFILYILGGCGLGIFFLAKARWIEWKAPILLAAVISSCQLLEHINQSPLIWFQYDTAISANGFLLSRALFSVFACFGDFVLLAISFIAAEALTRKAFPKHPQLWRSYNSENAASFEILGRTLGGYLSVGFFFGFVIAIYTFGTRCLGWWTPSDILFHPNGLASYFPWFTAVANSLHAGVWEECLFRAVPIAGAALLGARFGHRKKWIATAFIVQALIFASAHANYPTQPSYARVIELIIPSFLFGWLYLNFGLLPGIILHYTFDAVSFSLPLFMSSLPGIWIDRTLVILVSLIPLGIILAARIRRGGFHTLGASEFNGGWKPKPEEKAQKEDNLSETHPKQLKLKPAAYFGLAILGIVVLLGVNSLTSSKHPTFPLEVKREQAISIAKTALESANIHLPESWQPLAAVSNGSSLDAQFVWKSEGSKLYYDLMGTYLSPPGWIVRFVRFDTAVEERAEEYQVSIIKNGEIYRIRHDLPESRKGASLDEEKAKAIALAYAKKISGTLTLKHVSSQALQLPNRRDWKFIFSNPEILLKQGEARVSVQIGGDEVTSSKRFIFVPEEWQREENDRNNFLSIGKTLSAVVLIFVFLIGIGLAFRALLRKEFSTHIFVQTLGFVAVIELIELANGIPGILGRLSTVAPRANQMISYFSGSALKALFISIGYGLLVGFIHKKQTKSPKWVAEYSGVSIGLAWMSVIALANLLETTPQAGSVFALDSYLPAIAGINSLEYWIFASILLSLAALLSDRIRNQWIRFLFLFSFGFGLCGMRGTSVSDWLVRGTLGGMFWTIASTYLFRSHLNWIPAIAGTLFILMEVQQAALAPYSGVVWESAVSIALVVALHFHWQYSIGKAPRKTGKKSMQKKGISHD